MERRIRAGLNPPDISGGMLPPHLVRCQFLFFSMEQRKKHGVDWTPKGQCLATSTYINPLHLGSEQLPPELLPTSSLIPNSEDLIWI